MEEYERLIRQMNELLNSEDIESDSEIVSAEDLKCALEYKLLGLKNAINNSELTKVKYKNLFSTVRICEIKKAVIHFNGKLSLRVKLDIGFKNYIYVDVGYNDKVFIDYLYDDERVIYVMEKAKPFFKQIFEEMKNNMDLIGNNISCDYVSSDELFKFSISFDDKFNVIFSPFKLSDVEDIDGIGDKMWFTRKSINEVYKENSEELYSKVGIEVKKLPVYLQYLIGDYLSSKKAQKLILSSGEINE